jgi:hypothetical protein
VFHNPALAAGFKLPEGSVLRSLAMSLGAVDVSDDDEDSAAEVDGRIAFAEDEAERAVVKDSLSRTLARTGRTIRFADEGEGEEGLGQAQGNDLALPEPDDDDDAATDQGSLPSPLLISPKGVTPRLMLSPRGVAPTGPHYSLSGRMLEEVRVLEEVRSEVERLSAAIGEKDRAFTGLLDEVR